MISRGAHILHGLILVALLGGAVHFGYLSYRKNQEVRSWFNAEPAHFRIDLSKPGITSAPFHQVCDVAHGEYVCLETEPGGWVWCNELVRRFAALSGEVRIVSKNGHQAFVSPLSELSDDSLSATFEPEPLRLVNMHSVPRGEYTIVVDVREPAPVLAHIPTVLTVRYHLCGMEALPALQDAAWSFFLGLAWAVFLIILVAGYVRRKKSQPALRDELAEWV